MQEVSPVSTRQTSIWRAGLGSHASDSSGAIFFGVIYLFLAFELSRLLLSAVILFCLGLTYLGVLKQPLHTADPMKQVALGSAWCSTQTLRLVTPKTTRSI